MFSVNLEFNKQYSTYKAHLMLDIHTHITEYNHNEITEVIKRAKNVGVKIIIAASTTINSCFQSIKLSNKYNIIYSGIGLHPMDLKTPINETILKTLENFTKKSNKIVTFSEIGLDFLDDMPDRKIQYDAFREQIRLSIQLNLPIIFHSRNADLETLRILKEEQAYKVGGAMHYFQSDINIANKVIDLGFNISIAKPILNNIELQKTVKNIPLNKIVLETDSAPQPFKKNREKWTEPRHLYDIAEKLSSLYDCDINELQKITSKNSYDMLFKIPI